ncbi:MAG: hypothetical protein D6754_13900 [Alphaproteobacteria bacterium]|nr:MAG: hypothetical protein D6754_13900 [Alphaproteobacteria bacterium]
MRPLVLFDLFRAAAVLRQVRGTRARHRRLRAIFTAAEMADRARLAGELSPGGDGTLAAACRFYPDRGEIRLSEREDCACLALVLNYFADGPGRPEGRPRRLC